MRKEPWVPEDRSAEHDAISAGFFYLCMSLRNAHHVTISQDQSIAFHFVPYFYCPLHPLPLRGNLGHLFACACRDSYCRRFFRQKFGQPFLENIFVVTETRLYRDRQPRTFFGGTDELSRLCRVLDETRSRTGLLY